jgi:O-antigen/teichoic acid export membrane protein
MIAVSKIYNRFKIYIFNTSWIMGEKFLTLGVGFFVTVLVARYLGPERYGILAYALSLTALFSSAGHMGLGGLVVREIVKKPDSRAETLGTSLVLKLFGYLGAFVAIFIYALIFEKRQSLDYWILLVVASSLLFKPFDVIDFWFQAYVQAKYTAIARSASLLITAGFKIMLVLISAELLFFASANLLQSILAACFLLLLFRTSAGISITTWSASFSRARALLSQGWVIFLGAFFATIYLKIDQIMLKWFVGAKEVGIYAVAATLSETWYFVPTAIVVSLFPKLIELKETDPERFGQRLQQIFELLFMIALLVAIFMNFMGAHLINLFFGQQYLASAPILAIHIWAALFIFMRAAFSKWILIEDALMFSLITQGLGALANVGLNLLLIPRYGGYGAAIATLLSYATASYFSLFFYKKSRQVFWMMSKAILSPVRYSFAYLKLKLL